MVVPGAYTRDDPGVGEDLALARDDEGARAGPIKTLLPVLPFDTSFYRVRIESSIAHQCDDCRLVIWRRRTDADFHRANLSFMRGRAHGAQALPLRSHEQSHRVILGERRNHRSADRSRVTAWIPLLPAPPIGAHFLYVSRRAPLQQSQRKPRAAIALPDVSAPSPHDLVRHRPAGCLLEGLC